jgi:hypothetical protein
MPSKKQRRRREKLKRHDWEYVEVDDEGNEVPLEPAQLKKAEANGKPRARGGRVAREVKPPSWNRALKRGALFVPILYLFLSVIEHVNPATAVGISFLYAAAFVPMFFFVDRMAYRGYRRRLDRS